MGAAKTTSARVAPTVTVLCLSWATARLFQINVYRHSRLATGDCIRRRKKTIGNIGVVVLARKGARGAKGGLTIRFGQSSET